jgi:hypothetical protein
MRPAVDQIRQRLRAQRPGRKIGHSPPGVGNAARPTTWVAGASLGKAPVRIARAIQKEIRINRLRFLDSGSGKQELTGRIERIGINFRHRRGSGTNEASMWVHYMFPSRAATWAHASKEQSAHKPSDRAYGRRLSPLELRPTARLRRKRSHDQASGSSSIRPKPERVSPSKGPESGRLKLPQPVKVGPRPGQQGGARRMGTAYRGCAFRDAVKGGEHG